MQQINTFWRSTSESPFFWETGEQLEGIKSSNESTESHSEQEADGNGKQVEAEKEAEK